MYICRMVVPQSTFGDQRITWSVLTVYHVSPRNQIQVFRLGNMHLSSSSHLTIPCLLNLCPQTERTDNPYSIENHHPSVQNMTKLQLSWKRHSHHLAWKLGLLQSHHECPLKEKQHLFRES